MSSSPIELTLFADFASPHCYVTDAALRSAAREHPLSIRYRALEIFPPEVPPGDPAEVRQWAMDAAREGDRSGLDIRAQPFVPRTRKAHEAAAFAAEHDLEEPLRDALYAAYWRDGLDIGRIDVLTSVGERVGLDAEEMKIALDIDRFRDPIRADAALAKRLKIRTVPTLFIGSGPGARILVGMQTAGGLDSALRSR